MKSKICHTRRNLLKGTVALALAGLGVRPVLAANQPRELAFYNLHTGESLKTQYWAEGSFIADGLADINHILRDFRTNQVQSIEPNLLELLYQLQTSLGSSQPFQIISGYRSPITNANLASHSEGVAKHSLHMEGKAIDLRIEGVTLNHLRQAAIALRGGGVGYYPNSNFVHVDVGRIRSWGQ